MSLPPLSFETTEPLVRRRFTVRDKLMVEDGSVEYKVVYEGRSKGEFALLLGEMRGVGLTPRLYGTRDDATLVISRDTFAQPPTRAPVILLSFTLLSIIVTGWFLSTLFQRVSPSQPILAMTAGFIVGVVAILGLHELAHRRLSRRHGTGSSLPYYIPNIPVFSGLPLLSFLPTFGAVTFMRGAVMNRDALFDLYFVGPVVAAAVALVVSVFGAMTSVVLTQAQYHAIFAPRSGIVAVSMNPSLLQDAVKSLTTAAGLSQVPSGGSVYISSPIDIAAWVGFLITFLTHRPAAVFDGGILANMVLGDRGSRITTAATALILLVVDVPNYWVVVLLIFLLAARSPSADTLDSLSGLARSKRALYAVAVLLLLLCAPVPQNLAMIPLGSG